MYYTEEIEIDGKKAIARATRKEFNAGEAVKVGGNVGGKPLVSNSDEASGRPRLFEERYAAAKKTLPTIPVAEKKEDVVSPAVVEPEVKKEVEKTYSLKDLEEILNRFTKGFASVEYVQSMIKDSVADELKNIGNSGSNDATKYLRLPYEDGNYYKSAEWGPGGGGVTYDYCYVGTTKVTIPTKTTDFLKIKFGSSPSASWVAAMPETQDSDAVVFDVTKNRIYLSGEFGSG
jgi:hypothetical protein